MLKAITNSHEIREAYEVLVNRLRGGAKRLRRIIGWPHGSGLFTAYWHEPERFWAVLSPSMSANRYWLAFGVQDPRKFRTMSITCEINPPKHGADRRCAGILLRGSRGDLYLGHSGRVGGGRRGVGKRTFLAACRGKTQSIAWGEAGPHRTTEVVVLGKITGPDFLVNLARFIVDVDNFKRGVREPSIDALIEKEAEIAESEQKFDPDSLVDARRRELAAVIARRGQPEFRRKLLRAYERRCAITGCDCPDALEAAHIQCYLGTDTNHITNGLLLRSDVHTLFDLRKITVADDYTLIVSDDLRHTVYGRLDGKLLRLPVNPADRPNRKMLERHRVATRSASF